ncbi:MAG: L-serine ammonia-lyase, iron-sulfur-dependent, subunit beta [Lachnospiraceae bacterium]|nr:L-serine ammonia-lyase, iron-sulfur-dependent, subunit beta [Lachnospiraceae bacterium]
MQLISVFDVIGPNMIGPSSSHTAGALRIALMARKIVDKPIKDVTFILYGSFARTYHGHGTDRALLAGILGYDTEDKRIRESFRYAQEAGITFRFQPDTQETDVHPNTARILITDADGDLHNIMGESVGGGKARIREVDGLEVDINGDMPTMIIVHHDEPGVIARITDRLYLENINIAFIDLSRKNRNGEAVVVMELDSPVEEDVIRRLKKVPAVRKVIMLEF